MADSHHHDVIPWIVSTEQNSDGGLIRRANWLVMYSVSIIVQGIAARRYKWATTTTRASRQTLGCVESGTGRVIIPMGRVSAR